MNISYFYNEFDFFDWQDQGIDHQFVEPVTLRELDDMWILPLSKFVPNIQSRLAEFKF